ncbi:MAG: leucine-rich repeat domain-containing protein [Acutalibacteraceae bacterium]
MKKHNFAKILISVVVLILSLTTVTVFAQPIDTGKNYDDSVYRIIDNVVYGKTTDSKGREYCYVVEYGATREIREKMTQINIVSQIDGVPVTSISGYRYDYDYETMYVDTYYPNVTKITIPDTVTKIGNAAFSVMPKLKSVRLPKNLKELGREAFKDLKYIKEVTIPEKVTTISDETFKNCVNLKKINFEGDIKTIGEGAFYNCKNLEKFPSCKKLEAVGIDALYGCVKVNSFYFPDTLFRIGTGAFAKTALRSAVIPYKVKFITPYHDEEETNDHGVFAGCKKLQTVVFEDRTDRLSLEIPDNFFNGCTSLDTVVLPPSICGISISKRTFEKCTNLKAILNSDKISFVGDAAFAYCENLKSIKLAPSTFYIGRKAFLGCTKLTSVTFTDTNKAPRVDSYAFVNTPAGMKFYVKNATVAKKLKTALKGSGVNNASIYYSASNKLAYKNVK